MSNDTRPETTDDATLLTDTRLEYLPAGCFAVGGIALIGAEIPSVSITVQLFIGFLLVVFGVTDALGTFMKRRGQ